MSSHKYLKRDRGQGTIEFALALPIFVLAFFAVVEFTHLFYVQMTLRQALRQAGRYMVTGQGQVDSNPDTSPVEARLAAIKALFCERTLGTGLHGPTCEAAISLETDSGESDGGAPGQTVTLTATFTKPWFTILFDQFAPGGVTLKVSTTWVNYDFVTVS